MILKIKNFIFMFKAIKSIFIIITALTIGHTALAASDPLFFNTQITIPGSDFITGQKKLVGDNASLLCDYIVAIYKYAITIVGIFAMLAVAIGGALWLMAAGNESRVTAGKSWIAGGLLGLILALSAFIILSSISKDLVTCKLDNIKKIVPLDAPNSQRVDRSTVYGKTGLTDKQVTDHLDSSGKYHCCVIKGKLQGSGFIFNTNIIRCATYEAGSKTLAQAKYNANNQLIGGCDYFYDKYSIHGRDRSLWTIFSADTLSTNELLDDNRLFLSPREGRRNNEDNSATVYEGKCWEVAETKKWCIGADHPEFCALQGDGKTCLTTTGDWGYCQNNGCHKCKKHCEACTADYQCPNQEKRPNSEAGVICGSAIYSFFSSDSNDCSDGRCDKEYDGGCP